MGTLIKGVFTQHVVLAGANSKGFGPGTEFTVLSSASESALILIDGVEYACYYATLTPFITEPQYFHVHNEFDEERVLCQGCLEFINEGIVDDRETFHSPVKTIRPIIGCHCCGDDL